ncbi:MAG: hypothetical protein NVS3B10_12540 [Polyangiales bacterium]
MRAAASASILDVPEAAPPQSSPPGSTTEAPPSSRRAPPSSALRARAAQRKTRRFGRMELRLTVGLVVMAGLPLVIGVLLAVFLARNAADLFYNPRVTQSIESSLAVYRPMVRALKLDMRHRADAIAASEPLRAAAMLHDEPELTVELRDAFDRYSDRPGPNPDDPPLVALVALEVYADLPLEECMRRFVPPGTPGTEGAGSTKAAHTEPVEPPPALPGTETSQRLGHVDRGAPVDEKRDYVLVQCRALGGDPEAIDGKAPMLVATFATDRHRIDQRDEANEFLEAYKGVAQRRDEWVRLNVAFYAALLGFTILISGAVGLWFARSVSGRVRRVAEAAGAVAAGNLEVRVPEEGDDEVGDLAVSFNRMLGEVERSRARIEYLQRIGAWQDMARRLAHEIKNPLTPIQLAVEEVHHKLLETGAPAAGDAKTKKLLDTTLEIVTEEVGTLRRLVSEFSEFARLPRARLEDQELVQLLRDARPTLEQLGKGTDETDLRLTPSGGQAIPVRVSVKEDIEGELAASEGGEPVRVLVDKQMLRKCVDNLVRNAVQAIRARAKGRRVIVHASVLEDGRVALDVDDDGPGVPEGDRVRIFDPYFTTRTEGTGLGLAIVKKIVVEHGGAIGCDVSPMGGARFRIVLPASDSAEARAAAAVGT